MMSKGQWREHYLYDNPHLVIRHMKQRGMMEHAINCGDLLLAPIGLCGEATKYWLEYCAVMMANWRHENRAAYPADPENVTTHSMLLWLDLWYLPLPRLLWMIYPAGNLSVPIGHMGFRLDRETPPVCELDGILGNPEKHGTGLMSSAFRHITDLVQPSAWVVFPKPDNEAAKRFYSRLGFVPDTEGWNRYEGVCERWVWHRAKEEA